MKAEKRIPFLVRALAHPRARIVVILLWAAIAGVLYFVLSATAHWTIRALGREAWWAGIGVAFIAVAIPALAGLLSLRKSKSTVSGFCVLVALTIGVLGWHDRGVCFDRDGNPLCRYVINNGKVETSHEFDPTNARLYTKAIVDSFARLQNTSSNGSAVVSRPVATTSAVAGVAQGHSTGGRPTNSGAISRVSIPSAGSMDALPEQKESTPVAQSKVPLELLLEGDVDELSEAIRGKLAVPLASELPQGTIAAERLIISLRLEPLPAVYSLPRATVRLSWRKVDVGSGAVLGVGSVDDLIANAPEQALANRRAVRVAVDTMMARIQRDKLLRQ